MWPAYLMPGDGVCYRDLLGFEALIVGATAAGEARNNTNQEENQNEKSE